MTRNKKVIIYSVIVTLMTIVSNANASQFFIDGKPASKGEALIAKAKNDKVIITKVDEQIISSKGTLKNKPKED